MRFSFALIDLALAACATTNTNSEMTLRVQNDSQIAIVDIRLAPINSSSLGANRIAGELLSPGEEMSLNTSCGLDDATVTAASGATCILTGLDLCDNRGLWVVDDGLCPAFAVR